MGLRGRQLLVVVVSMIAVATTVTVVGAVAGPGETTLPQDQVPVDRHSAGAVSEHDTDPPPRRLGLDGDVTAGYAVPRPDLGAAVSLGDAEYRGSFEAYRARDRVENADSESERRAAIRTAIDRTGNRTGALREREAAAIRAYRDGGIDTYELLRQVALVDAEAGALQAALIDVQDRNRDVIGFSLSQDLVTVNGDLQSLRTPVREAIGESLRGRETAGVVHARASGNGLVVEAIDGDVYLRDAVRMDNYAPGEVPEMNATRALERTEELYPETFPIAGSPSLDSIGSRLYSIEFAHAQGRIVLYLDTTTGDPYREFQSLRLDRLATTPAVTVTGNDTEVRINRTARDNPYQVTVTDADSGTPLDATVSVEDNRVGETDDEGQVWVLGSTGEFEVTVETGTETINATVPGE